jgi:hypothetical protein
MKSISGKIIECLKKAGFNPIFTEKEATKYDPNEIVEIYTPYMMVRHLPPERITRKEFEKRIERENKQYHNWTIRFLKQKRAQEKWDMEHPSKTEFRAGYQNTPSYALS